MHMTYLEYVVGREVVHIPTELQMPFISPAKNLAEAHAQGIRPLAFQDIRMQFQLIGKDPEKNMVLTDFSPNIPDGWVNNWRILTWLQNYNGHGTIDIQLTQTGHPGLIDNLQFPIIHVSIHDILFTGVYIVDYHIRKLNEHISLAEYHRSNPKPDIFLYYSKRFLANHTGSL